MKLRLTAPALRQLDRVLAYLDQHNPQGARRVQARIHEAMVLLLQHPYAGQATARPSIRRIVVSSYPYVMTYRVGAGEIIVRSIRHTARRPLA